MGKIFAYFIMMSVFNFFSEIKRELKLPDFEGGYNIVNINGKTAYIEGHRGLISLSDNLVMIKVKDKIVSVNGCQLKLKQMSSNTMSIVGEIQNIAIN
jgi:sporulation protein YqfC